MGLLKAQVVFPALSGLPEDNCVNTLYFSSGTIDDPGAPSPTEITDVRNRISDFYSAVHPTNSIGEFMGEQISRITNACSIDFYWHATPDEVPATWGSPYATRSWTLDDPLSTTPLPSEVAAVISFHGDLEDVPETATNPDPPPAKIRPAARRRGRIYIGPLGINTLAENSSTHEAQLATTFITALTGAAAGLIDDNDADWQWVVASKADNAYYEVVGGFVDNAFDTQRRRGQDATSRTAWS